MSKIAGQTCCFHASMQMTVFVPVSLKQYRWDSYRKDRTTLSAKSQIRMRDSKIWACVKKIHCIEKACDIMRNYRRVIP